MVALSLCAGCPRPAVDVEESLGAAGEFCVTGADCNDSMACFERSCCPNDNCGQICASLTEKDDTAGRHPGMTRFARRRCVSMCCAGADTAKIERVLSAWASGVPEHGLTGHLNAP